MRRRLEDLPLYIPIAWALWALTSIHVFLMRSPACLNRWDEGYLTAFGARMIEGHMLPYVDAVSQRGPILYWLSALAVRFAGGPWSWMPMRVLGALSIVVAMGSTFVVLRRTGHKLAATVMVLESVAGFVGMLEMKDGLAFNGEHAVNIFMFTSLLCATVGLHERKPSVGWTAASGALAACSILCKQFALLAVAPIALWVLTAAIHRPGLERAERRRLAGAFVAGGLGPVLLVLARYAAAGEVKTLWYWLYTYNSKIYMAPYTWSARFTGWGRFINIHWMFFLVMSAIIAWGVARLAYHARSTVSLLRAYDERGLEITITLGTAASIVAALAPMRFFGHYFVQAVPWAAMLMGLVCEHVIEIIGRIPRLRVPAPVLRGLLLVPVTIGVAIGFNNRYRDVKKDWEHYPDWRDAGAAQASICKVIAANSQPGDAIFVWGFSPDYYVRCANHRVGSRYVFNTMQSGFVPWMAAALDVEEARVVPGSRETLIADLEASHTTVIVDAPASLGWRSMTQYPMLAKYVRENFCELKRIEDKKIFIRRDASGACQKPDKV